MAVNFTVDTHAVTGRSDKQFLIESVEIDVQSAIIISGTTQIVDIQTKIIKLQYNLND